MNPITQKQEYRLTQKHRSKPEGGWPHNPEKEQFRLYADKPEGYLLVDVTPEGRNPIDHSRTCLCNVIQSSEPFLCTSGVSDSYIATNRLKRVQWNEIPSDWQEAFQSQFDSDWKPEDVPGLWRVRNAIIKR